MQSEESFSDIFVGRRPNVARFFFLKENPPWFSQPVSYRLGCFRTHWKWPRTAPRDSGASSGLSRGSSSRWWGSSASSATAPPYASSAADIPGPRVSWAYIYCLFFFENTRWGKRLIFGAVDERRRGVRKGFYCCLRSFKQIYLCVGMCEWEKLIL